MNELNPNTPGSRRHYNLEHLKGVSGTYILRKGKNIYVGSTHNLQERLRYHSRKYRGWEFEYKKLPLEKARKLERELIKKFQQKGVKLDNINLYGLEKNHPDVSRQLFHARIKAGWDEARARTTPPRQYGQKGT